jgi:hypothetical protein
MGLTLPSSTGYKAMSRTESLFQRLAHLENELMSAVIVELQKEAGGEHSMYFARKRKFIAQGKKYQDEHTAQIEWLEKEITSLRRRLGEPYPGAILALAQEFPRVLSDEVNPWEGGSVALAREIHYRVQCGGYGK